MSEEKISYMPTDGLCYDPNDDIYWDEVAMQKELNRAYEICNGCRMCFKYCDVFPDLFKLLDNKYEGKVSKVTAEETDKIMNSCFQCKLCEVQCPYTPRDKHEFQLDFPKIVHRYQALKFKKEGGSLRDSILGDPDKSAAMARASFGMANAMNKVKLHRWFLEKLVGIHRDKLLPDFAGTPFSKWATKADKLIPAEEKPEVILFPTCYVENNEPQIGRDTVEVLETNKVKVACSKGLDCCGMPSWEHGNLEKLREHAINNINKLLPYVENGAKILAINPTCSMMLRNEYKELLSEEYKEKAELISKNVMDPSEFLWEIRHEDRFVTAPFIETTKIAYHAPCHLRVQAKGFKARDLVKKVTGNSLATTMECCGHNGTYAMKEEYFESSAKIGKKAFDSMKSTNSEIWLTDCPLAAIQFDQHAGVRPMHPMSYLAKVYRTIEHKHPNKEENNEG